MNTYEIETIENIRERYAYAKVYTSQIRKLQEAIVETQETSSNLKQYKLNALEKLQSNLVNEYMDWRQDNGLPHTDIEDIINGD